MYSVQQTVDKIKVQAKQKNILIKDLLEACQLNKNTLSSMSSRGSWIQPNSLAKIADCLDCSVDYLLGRSSYAASPSDASASPEEQEIISIYRSLSDEGQEKLYGYAKDLQATGQYIKSNSSRVGEKKA